MRNLSPILIFLFSFMACQPVEMEIKLEITTEYIQHIEYLTYKFFGSVAGLKEEEIAEHGFCWSESENPDISGPSIKLGPKTTPGDFSCLVSDFLEGTNYYVRAYAVVASKVIYGNEISFITGRSAGNTVKDAEGNVYQTVRIGNQTWMAQNLKVREYADGTPILQVKDKDSWYNFSEASKAYCYYDNESNNSYLYGALYTWAAATNGSESSDLNPSGVQGVCPEGWHLPSDSEWKELEIFLGMTPEDADKEKWRGEGVGGKMKREGGVLWKSPNSGANNESGFDALPGGYRHGSGEFLDMGSTARFWTSTMNNTYGWIRRLDYDTSAINRFSDGLYRAHSVRCVQDE